MNLLRNAATVSVMTLASRVLGFVRDILIAGMLGAGPVADAFFAAFQFPNLFRRLFAEGAFNAAFVPLYAKRLEGEGPEDHDRPEKAVGGKSHACRDRTVEGGKESRMNLLRNAATVSVMTLASRVLGFVRDILIAGMLGAGPVADAFFAAFQFPNLFRRLFAEGAFNAAFVPLYAKRLEGEGPEAAADFAEQALAPLWFGLVILTALAIAFMPWLIYVIAPGFAPDVVATIFGSAAPFDTVEDTGKLALTTQFTRILFPYLLFISLMAFYTGMLNSAGKFALAALAPVLMNVMAIGALGLAWLSGLAAGPALVWGLLISGVVQFLAVWWGVRRIGIRLHLRRPRLTDETRRFGQLFLPGLIAGGTTQINLLIGGAIATFQEGARSWLFYADRIYQFPLGLIGVAIGIALLPDLARRLRAGDSGGAVATQNRACETAMLLTLPAAAALIAVPGLIVAVLFQRGAFSAADAVATSGALAIFALGLPAFVLVKVFSPAYFAREDTRTPLRFAMISVVVNIVVSLAVFPVFGHYGIAAATALSSWINAGMLFAGLYRRGEFVADHRLKRRLGAILAASTAMGGGVYFLAAGLQSAGQASLPVLLVAVVAGVAGYGMCTLVLGAARPAELRTAFARPKEQQQS